MDLCQLGMEVGWVEVYFCMVLLHTRSVGVAQVSTVPLGAGFLNDDLLFCHLFSSFGRCLGVSSRLWTGL